MKTARTETGLSTGGRLLFGAGTFGSSAPFTVLAQLQLYFTKYLGYNPTIISNVRGFAIFLDAFLDPVMGYISDRTRSRFGRRMPYIAIGSLLYAAGVIGMWFAPGKLSTLEFYLYLILVQVVFSVGITMTGIPFTALIPEVAREYTARTTLASWMQAGAYLGNIWGGAVRWYSTWRGDEIRGFQEFAVYSSLIMIVGYWLFVMFVKEPPLTEQQRAELGARRDEMRAYLSRHVAGLFRSLSYALGSRQFLILFFSIFLYQVGVQAGIWMYTFLLDDWFGRTWNTPFAAQFLIGPLSLFRDAFFLYIFFAIGCGLLFLPVWNWIGRYVEKKTCLLIGILGIGLTYGSSYLLFAPKSFPLLIVYCLLQACFYCAAYIFPTSMLADVATHSEWARGEANEGMFYGANSFLTKLHNAAAIVWTGFALRYVVGYQEGADVVQTPETLWRMRVLYAVPACITAFLAIAVLLLYDLDRKQMAQIETELAARRAISSGAGETGS